MEGTFFNMINATKKWIVTKIFSGLLIPFMIWFIVNLVSLFNANNSQLVEFFSDLTIKVIFSLFLILVFSFYTLTISEIFEDYLHNEKIKNVANKALNLFAILIPLLTILSIYNLN